MSTFRFSLNLTKPLRAHAHTQWPIGICQAKRTIPFVWALQLLFVLIIEIKSISNCVFFLLVRRYLFIRCCCLFLAVTHSLVQSSSISRLDFVWYTIKNWRIRGPNNTKKQLRLLQIPFGGQRLADTCTIPMLCVFLIVCPLGECLVIVIVTLFSILFGKKCIHIWCMYERVSVICNVRAYRVVVGDQNRK